jgi:acyl dehydratase
MSTAVEDYKVDLLNVWSDPREYKVTKEATIAYAEATNDEHPKHLSGELAPPLFAVVPGFESLGPSVMGVVPPEILMTVVHGEQDMLWHQPIVPGMTLSTTAAPIGIHGRSSGLVVVGKSVTTTADGEPVVDQYMTAFFRGAKGVEIAEGEEPTEHGFDEALREKEPLGAETYGYDEGQTHRYSKASGDPMPIHLDDDFAKQMGLPGIIVHGLCTMAYTSRAVIATCCPEDPARLNRLAVRFAKIVQPVEKVTTTMWDAGDGNVAFETTSDNGNTAIKDGLAHVA